MEVNVRSLPESYGDILRMIPQAGQRVAPRGDATWEVLNFNLTVASSTCVLPVDTGRQINTGLGDELALQLLAGVYLPARLAFQPGFVDDDKLENYGPLLAPSFYRAERYLREDRYSRRAAANLGHTGGDSGYPCTLSLGWIIREGELHAFSEMRSQDAWLGLPYDLHMFAAAARSLAYLLDVAPGPLHHRVRSFHLYERDLEKVQRVGSPGRFRPTTMVRRRTWQEVQDQAIAQLGWPEGIPFR